MAVPAAGHAVHRQVEVSGGPIHLVEQGDGPARPARPRLPRELVLVAPPAARARRGRLPRGRDRRPRLRALARPRDGRGVPDARARRRQRRASSTRWARRPRRSSATTGARRSRPPRALLRPDVFTAVGLLGVPYTPRGADAARPRRSRRPAATRSSTSATSSSPAGPRPRSSPTSAAGCAGFYVALSGDRRRARRRVHDPAGRHDARPLPATRRCRPGSPRTTSTSTPREFERTGLTGALNRYRNVDRDWEDLAAWDGVADQPARRSSSAASSTPRRPGWPTRSTPTRSTLPGLAASHILDGCGHWVQQERPDEVNRLLIDWLSKERRHDLGGETPHALPGIAAADQHVADADRRGVLAAPR